LSQGFKFHTKIGYKSIEILLGQASSMEEERMEVYGSFDEDDECLEFESDG